MASPGQFPHSVILDSFDGKFSRCGGSILTTYLIVTAAHCLRGKMPRHMTVTAGVQDRSKDTDFEQKRSVKQFYLHENYTGGVHNDIGLIVLEEPLQFSKHVQPIDLPRPGEEFYGSAQIIGFGHMKEDSSVASGVLRKVDVPIIRHAECSRNYSEVEEEISVKMICAGAPGRDSCSGDSGGSMLCQRRKDRDIVLCGIISWGFGCGEFVRGDP